MIDKNKILKITTSNEAIKIFKKTKNFEFLKFYNNIENFLKKDILYGEIGEKFIFCIAIDLKSKERGEWNLFGKGILTSKIKKGLLDKNNVILSDIKGNVINIVKGKNICDYVNATKLSKNQSCPVFFIDYMTVHLSINGEPLLYIANVVDSIRKGVVTNNSLPAREYRKLIEKQYQSMVHKQKCFTYWKEPKKNRILISNAESLFNRNLWWYLNEYIMGAEVERDSPISGIEDKPDIRIITFESGDIYLIEIKCLGKTKSSSSEKSDACANEGLVQLNIYLNDEKYAKEGVLVLYDGRKNDQDIKLNWNSIIKWHSGLDRKPMRFYLESESASVKAKKIYSNMKKKNSRL